jgi:hypothetical protein
MARFAHLAVLSLVLVVHRGFEAAAVEEPETIMVAGVPIVNYQNHYYTTADPIEASDKPVTDWVLNLKSAKLTDELIQKICNAQGVCLAIGNPLKGGVPFVMVQATESQLEALLAIYGSHVDFVEPDAPMELIPDMDENITMDVLGNVASWGLDRIDDRHGLDGSYDGAATGGSGVHVYVADTGIRTTHRTFGGRAFPAIEIKGNNLIDCGCDFDCARDGNGHGTHCAGTIGGDEFGVARGVTLHAVKVLGDSGSGSWSGFVRALDWVSVHGQRPAVLSASLGGSGRQFSVGNAVESATKAGVTVVVAAGNSRGDACNYSPAYSPSALTVGATESSDKRASFSNYGKCLDLFAPGVKITSAWRGSDTSTKTISGTSMACPHVSGAAALLLQADPSATPFEIASKLKSQATAGAVVDPKGGSPNLLLYVDPSVTPPTTTSGPSTSNILCTTTTTTTTTTTAKPWLPTSGFCGFEKLATPFCGWHQSMHDDFEWARKNGKARSGSHYVYTDVSALEVKYKDLGLGKCLHQGREPDSSYHHGAGAEECRGLCNRQERCGGYSVSSSGNCLLWLGALLSGGGDDWGGARCHVKDTSVTYSAILKAPTPELQPGASLSFFYRMEGASTTDMLKVEVQSTTGSIHELWSKSGNQGDQWLQETLPLDRFSEQSVVISIVGIRGSAGMYTSEVAIDDVMLSIEKITGTTTANTASTTAAGITTTKMLKTTPCTTTSTRTSTRTSTTMTTSTSLTPAPTPAPTPPPIACHGCITLREAGGKGCLKSNGGEKLLEKGATSDCAKFRVEGTLFRSVDLPRQCLDYFHSGGFGLWPCHGGRNQQLQRKGSMWCVDSNCVEASSPSTTVTTTLAITTLTTTVAVPTITPTPAPTPAPTPGPKGINSGDTVFLKTRSGKGKHIDIEGVAVRARWESRGAWQAIRIEKESGGTIYSGDVVYLKAHTGAHIDVFDGIVQARWNDTGSWQAMTIEKRIGSGAILPDDIVCLKAHTLKNLDVEDDVVRARWNECESWQAMKIEKEVVGALRSADSIHLLAHTGNRVEVDGTVVRARWSEPGLWQTFVIETYGGRAIYSGDAVFLRAHTGALLHVQDTAVAAVWDEKGAWQTFTIQRKDGSGPVMPGDNIFLRAHTGRFVEVSGDAVQANWWEMGKWQTLVVERSAFRRLTEQENVAIKFGKEPEEPSNFFLV